MRFCKLDAGQRDFRIQAHNLHHGFDRGVKLSKHSKVKVTRRLWKTEEISDIVDSNEKCLMMTHPLKASKFELDEDDFKLFDASRYQRPRKPGKGQGQTLNLRL